MKERILYIDWLKGIAITLVVMGHVIGFDIYSGSDCMNSFLYRLIISFHMPLFVFLSGLVVNYEYKNLTSTIKLVVKKIKTLLFPFLIVGILYVLWRGISINRFFEDSNKFGYWYLLTLFELYIVYYLVYSFKLLNSQLGYIVKGLIVWIILRLLTNSNLFDSNILNIFQLPQLQRFWPFFFIASFINKYHLHEKLFSNNKIYSLSLVSFLLSFTIFEYYSITVISYPLQLSAIFIVVYIIYSIRSSDNILLRCINLFGKYSLDIYIFHYFILHISYFKILGNYLSETPNLVLELLITGIFSFIIIYISIFIGQLIRKSNILSYIIYSK